MAVNRSQRRVGAGLAVAGVGGLGLLVGLVLGVSVIAAWLAPAPGNPADSCGAGSAAPGGTVVVGPAGGGLTVGASEYGGPGDPSSGTVGASGQSLATHPDSYAELGGTTFQTATAMGGLPYMTPLRISVGDRSAIAYKRDFGLGGGPVAGRPRVIDLWWRLAGSLGIPYERGLWSGPVRIARAPATGASALLSAGVGAGAQAGLGAVSAPGAQAGLGAVPGAGCDLSGAGVPITAGPAARLLPGGIAAAPSGAPAAVRGMIAAGNAIAGRPYVYGAGHGLPLDRLSPAYDCSSSVEHLLWGGGLLPAGYGAASSALESFGAPGPGRWVTLYANPDHVFMYVAGLRWDTWNAAGAGDGSDGIGWHPLVRDASGFVARHPVGL
ncbi:MAG TPA: hypothetical protein VFN55_01880 [Solirubrobacteraceae bacterium]|nr:hypothetical protein [Solirubrobacteraceae bacterium]